MPEESIPKITKWQLSVIIGLIITVAGAAAVWTRIEVSVVSMDARLSKIEKRIEAGVENQVRLMLLVKDADNVREDVSRLKLEINQLELRLRLLEKQK